MTPQQFIHNMQSLIRHSGHDLHRGDVSQEMLQTLESLRVSLNSNPLRYFLFVINSARIEIKLFVS